MELSEERFFLVSNRCSDNQSQEEENHFDYSSFLLYQGPAYPTDHVLWITEAQARLFTVILIFSILITAQTLLKDVLQGDHSPLSSGKSALNYMLLNIIISFAIIPVAENDYMCQLGISLIFMLFLLLL